MQFEHENVSQVELECINLNFIIKCNSFFCFVKLKIITQNNYNLTQLKVQIRHYVRIDKNNKFNSQYCSYFLNEQKQL